MKVYTPANYKNYIDFLSKCMHANMVKRICDFNLIEFTVLIKGIERFEGWKEGKIISLKGLKHEKSRK